MHDWFAAVRAWTTRLVNMPSVTDSDDERQFAPKLHEILATWPYFRAHPAHLWLARTTDDPRERFNLFALVRGSGSPAIALTGHYDVVGVANYGALADVACDPDALLPRLIAELQAHAQTPAEQAALIDMQSGDYLPGRGALDMKSGLAAGLAVLERFAAQPDRTGNLLFVATPDEEVASHGMRAAVQQLARLARDQALDFRAAINLDATGERDDEGAGRAIFLGSVGKYLPAVYVVGRETHAGAPFDGLNAALIAAEITRAIEANAALCDTVAGATAPPPVCLKQIDRKPHYDVTTPAAVWCYYNVLTHGRSAADILAAFTALVGDAMYAAIDHMHTRAQQWSALAGQAVRAPLWQPQVLTYADLRARAVARGGAQLGAELEALGQRLRHEGVDLPTLSCRMIEALWRHSGLQGPAAVIAFAALCYPPTLVGEASALEARVAQAAQKHAALVTAETGVPIGLRPFFPGISDMSFLGNGIAPADRSLLAANTPAWMFGAGLEATTALALPAINIGPWGREYHQRTERVHMPYSFAIVPELIWRIAHDLLG